MRSHTEKSGDWIADEPLSSSVFDALFPGAKNPPTSEANSSDQDTAGNDVEDT